MSERQADYRQRHPDRVKESQRKWREKNREHVREYSRDYKRRTQKDYRQRQKVSLWESLIGGVQNDDD